MLQRALNVAMQLASAFSHTPLSAFIHSCPLPPYPSYSSPSPAPLPCSPLIIQSSSQCRPCFHTHPTPLLAIAGYSHCSLNQLYPLSSHISYTCTALRAHIIFVEALYKINSLSLSLEILMYNVSLTHSCLYVYK